MTPSPRPRPLVPLVALAAIAGVAAVLLAGPALAGMSIPKSPNDDREYAYFTLDNGLRAVVVSDPTTDKAAASLDVNVGSGAEPDGRQGLAHFLEHMLFLGTEKYPKAGEYKDFIASHGGSDNAYTSFDHTNYFFDVDHAHLEEALDRFAQFFIAPVLNAEYVAREREVVHSEYTSKLKSDGRRIYHARRRAMNPAHPASRFVVGNRDTLADRPGAPVRDDLIEFYRKHYSASLMSLVVLGREPLDRLEAWVRERFSAVASHAASPMDTDEPLYTPGRLPVRLDIVPVKQQRSVTFSFPIPPVNAHYRTKPLYVFSDLIGHEGPGSLLATLKARGWADGLSAGGGFRHRSGATFAVSIQLTPEGLGHLEEIGELLFGYIGLVRESGIEPWRYAELRRLNDIRLRFEEKSDPVAQVRGLANDLHEYAPADLLTGPYLLESFEPELINEYLSHLRPDNLVLTVVDPRVETDHVGDFFGVATRLRPIEAATVARWEKGVRDQAFALSGPNAFIAENLALLDPDGASEMPARIVDEPGFELWHQQDTTFAVPRTDFYVSVRSPVANDSARSAVLAALYVDMVNDQLEEYSYAASIAGLGYDLYRHGRGFSIRLSGYSDKEERLLERVVSALRDTRLDPDRFEILREDFVRRLENTRSDPPFRRGYSELRNLLLDPRWTVDQRLQFARRVDLHELREFIPRLFERTQMVALAHGNLGPDRARELGRIARDGLIARSRPVDVAPARVVRLAPGVDGVREVAVKHSDQAAVVYLQAREKTLRERALAALLGHIVGPPFFDALRTERKLGYVVFGTSHSVLEVPGLAFSVQSPNTTAPDLTGHIETFLRGFRDEIAGLSGPELERHRVSLVSNILQSEQQLSERTNRYWYEIDRGYHRFDRREQLVSAVRSVDLESLLGFYDEVVLAPTRRRLVLNARTAPGEGVTQAEAARVIHDGTAFKAAHDRFPG